MAVADAIAALLANWNDVIARLSPEAAAEIAALVGELSDPVGRQTAADRIAGLLEKGLPVRHPVRGALVKGDLFAPSAADWDTLSAALIEQARLSLGSAAGSDAPSAADILQIVTERLLAAPALSEQQVRQRGADPADPGLVRLTRPDGSQQWPAFQFLPGNGPHPVVRIINLMLHAARDPVGVADWWLSRNSWLDGRPSELLGRVPDQELLGAAQAIHSAV